MRRVRAARAPSRAFATSTHIVPPASVASGGGRDATRIIDVGSLDAYTRAHVPGAVRLPLDPFLKDPSTGSVIDAALFVQLCAVLGVSRDTHVVAYDGGSVMWASRVWWLFQYYGHRHVSVLDGGWPGYLASGGPVSTLPVSPAFATDTPQAAPKKHLLATGQEVLHYVESGEASSRSVQLLDSRSRVEFSGEDKKGNLRGGHIPGAINVPHTDMLTPHGTFKSREELRSLFESAGLDLTRPSVSYCQAGIRGAMGILALRLAGSVAPAANYDASMKEWLNDPRYPVDTGAK